MVAMRDGGPAFPIVVDSGPEEDRFYEEGMSLRDWFAAMANEEDIDHWRHKTGKTYANTSREEARYLFADAMLVVRGKEASDGS